MAGPGDVQPYLAEPGGGQLAGKVLGLAAGQTVALACRAGISATDVDALEHLEADGPLPSEISVSGCP